MDILQTDRWLTGLFFDEDRGPTELDHYLNSYFDESGFSSLSYLKNIGSTLVYLVIYLLLILLIGLLRLLR